MQSFLIPLQPSPVGAVGSLSQEITGVGIDSAAFLRWPTLQRQNSFPVCVLYIFVYIYTSILGELQSAQTSVKLNQYVGSSANL